MAFTGVATIAKVSDRMFRITGLSLGIGAAGTIGLDGGSGDVDLQTGAVWGAYKDGGGGLISLIDAVQVEIGKADAVAAVAPAVRVVKTGTDVSNFIATLTNDGAAATGGLEIFVEYH